MSEFINTVIQKVVLWVLIDAELKISGLYFWLIPFLHGILATSLSKLIMAFAEFFLNCQIVNIRPIAFNSYYEKTSVDVWREHFFIKN